MLTKKINVFWWNEIKLQGQKFENYGDLIGKYLVEKISNKRPVWVHPSKFSLRKYREPIYVTVGSVLTHVNQYCVVWGSGIISKNSPIKKATFKAVRGPQTRKHLIEQGHDVPEIYGDPALLLPKFYRPKVKKKYSIGIVPHYVDYELVKEMYSDVAEITVINLRTNNVEEVTAQLLECEKILSSSLHGVIVAHAYDIPAVWQRFSDKVFGDNIKYQDYFEAVEIDNYVPEIIENQLSLLELNALFIGNKALPNPGIINKLSEGLLKVCPFKT